MKSFSKYKPDQYSKTFAVLLLLLETFSSVITFSIVAFSLKDSTIYHNSSFQTVGFLWLLLWVTISIFANTYEVKKHRRLSRIFSNTIQVAVFHFPLMYGITHFIGLEIISIEMLTGVYALHISVLLLVKSLLLITYRYIKRLERNRNNAVIFGFTPTGKNLYDYFINDKYSGYTFAGFFDNEKSHPMIIGDIRKMKKYCIRENINEIFFAMPYNNELIKEISSFADENFIRLAILQDIGSKKINTVDAEIYDNLPVLSVKSDRTYTDTKNRKPYQRALSVIRSINF